MAAPAARFADPLGAHDAPAIERVRVVVMDEARSLWSDQAIAAKWRLNIPGARRLSTRRALARLGYDDEALADRIADAFTEMRRQEYRLYPDAHTTVDALRQAGVKLALVTNGAGDPARQDRAFRPRPSLRPYPDRGRVRPGQARARGLPARAGEGRLRGLRRLDGRRQLRMGSRGAAEARHVRHLVRPVRRRRAGSGHGPADAGDQAAGLNSWSRLLKVPPPSYGGGYGRGKAPRRNLEKTKIR